MPNTPGLICRAAAAVGLALAVVAPVAAQKPEPNPPDRPAFLAGYNFHLAAAGLSADDVRFTWDTHWGGDVDLVDYVVGRGKVLVDYEALLGSEFRAFDPNQGNYVLEVSGSARVKGTEFAGVFHHVSRHLADRPKRFAVAWNVAGVRALRRVTFGGTQIDVRLEGGKVVQHAFVDYAWTAGGELRLDRPVATSVGVFGRADGRCLRSASGREHAEHTDRRPGRSRPPAVGAGRRAGAVRRRGAPRRRGSDRATPGALGVRGISARQSVTGAFKG